MPGFWYLRGLLARGCRLGGHRAPPLGGAAADRASTAEEEGEVPTTRQKACGESRPVPKARVRPGRSPHACSPAGRAAPSGRMVDADAALRLDGGLGVQGHAGAGGSSMGRSFAPSPTARASAGVMPSRAVIGQSLQLGLLAQDGVGDLAGQSAIGHQQGVRAMLVKAQPRRDRPVKAVKPPETSAAWAPCAFIVARSTARRASA